MMRLHHPGNCQTSYTRSWFKCFSISYLQAQPTTWASVRLEVTPWSSCGRLQSTPERAQSQDIWLTWPRKAHQNLWLWTRKLWVTITSRWDGEQRWYRSSTWRLEHEEMVMVLENFRFLITWRWSHCFLQVTGLEEGESYVFRVRAVSAVGIGKPSQVSEPVCARVLPGNHSF